MASSSSSSRNPRFFKPLLPGFRNKLKLPRAFLKHLEGEDRQGKKAILISPLGKSWPVKLRGNHVRGKWFEEGWPQFVADHCLSFADLLLFEYQGNLHFRVSVFGRNACEKHFVCLLDEDHKRSSSKYHTRKATPRELEEEDDPLRLTFEIKMTKYTAARPPLFLPARCRDAMKLQDETREIEIKDEKGKSWFMDVHITGLSSAYICRGWKSFAREKELVAGDVCAFELLSASDMKITILRSK